MNSRTIITLAVAIVFGLIAVFLVRAVLNNGSSAPAGSAADVAATGTVAVVVATGPVERGATLSPTSLKVVSYPASAAPAGAFSSIAELTAGPEPRRALRSLTANEPILATRVSGPNARLFLSTMLTEGMRAVSIRTNDVAGVGGFVLPGDRVDVILTRPPENDRIGVTQILAENVLVLGVDQSDNDEADKPVVSKAVTVEVSPDQAQTISLGNAVGTVSLSLRQADDELVLNQLPFTEANLGFVRRPQAQQLQQVSTAPRVPRPPPPPSASGPRPPANMVSVRVTRGMETTGYAVSR